MNLSLFICAIFLIVLGSCLPLCQNVEDDERSVVFEEGDNSNKHNLLRLIREADGIEAEFLKNRAKDVDKKKGKSVSKKSAVKNTGGSDDKTKKKLSKKHGDTLKSHKVIAINTTTTGNNKGEIGKDLTSGKNVSKNSLKAITEKPVDPINADADGDGIVDSAIMTKPPTDESDKKPDAWTLISLSVTPSPDLHGDKSTNGNGTSSNSVEKGKEEGSNEKDKAEGDSKKGNKNKPVYLAVDHSDKKDDSVSQKDSSEEEDDGPKVNVSAKDDATNITVKERSMMLFNDDW